MKLLRFCTVALARFFISLVFLTDVVSKIFHWSAAEADWRAAIYDWQSYVWFSDGIGNFFGLLAQWVPLLLIGATLFELLGALLILLGVKEKLGAGLLILVLLSTTLLFYPFWFSEGADREMQVAIFLKNLAIIGGLFLVLLNGIQSSKGDFDSSFT